MFYSNHFVERINAQIKSYISISASFKCTGFLKSQQITKILLKFHNLFYFYDISKSVLFLALHRFLSCKWDFLFWNKAIFLAYIPRLSNFIGLNNCFFANMLGQMLKLNNGTIKSPESRSRDVISIIIWNKNCQKQSYANKFTNKNSVSLR